MCSYARYTRTYLKNKHETCQIFVRFENRAKLLRALRETLRKLFEAIQVK